MVEQLAVNQLAAGSSPAPGAKVIEPKLQRQKSLFLFCGKIRPWKKWRCIIISEKHLKLRGGRTPHTNTYTRREIRRWGSVIPLPALSSTIFPETKIARGFIWTGKSEEMHFWNVLDIGGTIYHIDLSWRQFPPGSPVVRWALLSEDNSDGEVTVKRIKTLLKRVQDYLKNKGLI